MPRNGVGTCQLEPYGMHNLASGLHTCHTMHNMYGCVIYIHWKITDFMSRSLEEGFVLSIVSVSTFLACFNYVPTSNVIWVTVLKYVKQLCSSAKAMQYDNLRSRLLPPTPLLLHASHLTSSIHFHHLTHLIFSNPHPPSPPHHPRLWIPNIPRKGFFSDETSNSKPPLPPPWSPPP